MNLQEWLESTRSSTRAARLREHEEFVKGLAADFAALRADPEAWAEELAERALWDNTNADGLEDE
jgi:hypothetical protein